MEIENARVVSLAQNVPGPLAVARLRLAGAAVTKVEPLAGDPFTELSRAWYAEMHEGIAVERLDLKSERDHARMVELLCDADLFVTSQRPSALTRLRLDSVSLRASCPRLRFLRIVGSVHDPERPGHDLTYQAQAGLLGDAMPRSLFADVMASERAFAEAIRLLQQMPGSAADIGLLEERRAASRATSPRSHNAERRPWRRCTAVSDLQSEDRTRRRRCSRNTF